MKSLHDKREKEKQIVSLMIDIYCHKNHHTKHGLCDKCQKLKEYSQHRSDLCPFMETKTFCSNCKVHCYKQDMRNEIKKVMRFSGPRMIFYHPILAISHVIESWKEKRIIKNETK
ncbi:MAG: nitrous oxide-stimulated promoter family protein [Erysipelotrichaceae bacterium]|nr:nitrous oxide-stimulated promoter family protein [Erysipelotrichaceae bacterium]